VKLLRFLENRTIERVGGSKSLELDVRLVAATNRNLEEMVKEGEFREDLYFRLNVVRILMPPLRDRRDDVPLLIAHYLKSLSAENQLPLLTLEPGALHTLQNYGWPGNIRELRNFCENVVVLHRGGSLSEYDLDPRFRGATSSGSERGSSGETAAANPLSIEENEKRLLRESLIKARGNRTKAAALMGISRRTLHRKLVQWPELDVID